jgi:hypothetical protein
MVLRAARLDGFLWQDPAEGVKVLKNNAPDGRRPFTVGELRSISARVRSMPAVMPAELQTRRRL